MAGRTYAENRPYLLPETLEELTGPKAGAILLPPHLDWSERVELHLDDPAELKLLYQRVIREAAGADDLRRYLNAQLLRDIWPTLFLPVQARRLWEDRFPDLTLAA